MVKLAQPLAALAVALAPSAVAAKYIAPYGKGTFQLLALTDDGYSGTWVTNYHSGAGQNVVILQGNQSLTPAFKYSAGRGDIFYLGGTKPNLIPFSLALTTLTDVDSTQPEGYYIVSLDAGNPSHSNFTFSPNNRNTLAGPVGDGTPYDAFATFAACTVNGTVFGEGNLEEQLFWRGVGTPAVGEPSCRDVTLKAVFNH